MKNSTDTIREYAARLCDAVGCDLDVLLSGGSGLTKRYHYIRYVICRKFKETHTNQQIGEAICCADSWVSTMKYRFDSRYAKDMGFRRMLQTLDAKGFEDLLPHSPRTKTVSDKLNLALTQIDKTIAMLQKQKDEIYKIKETLPQMWEV